MFSYRPHSGNKQLVKTGVKGGRNMLQPRTEGSQIKSTTFLSLYLAFQGDLEL